MARTTETQRKELYSPLPPPDDLIVYEPGTLGRAEEFLHRLKLLKQENPKSRIDGTPEEFRDAVRWLTRLGVELPAGDHQRRIGGWLKSDPATKLVQAVGYLHAKLAMLPPAQPENCLRLYHDLSSRFARETDGPLLGAARMAGKIPLWVPAEQVWRAHSDAAAILAELEAAMNHLQLPVAPWFLWDEAVNPAKAADDPGIIHSWTRRCIRESMRTIVSFINERGECKPTWFLLRLVEDERHTIIMATENRDVRSVHVIRDMLLGTEFKPAYNAVRVEWHQRQLERRHLESLMSSRAKLINAALIFLRNPGPDKSVIDDSLSSLGAALHMVGDEAGFGQSAGNTGNFIADTQRKMKVINDTKDPLTKALLVARLEGASNGKTESEVHAEFKLTYKRKLGSRRTEMNKTFATLTRNVRRRLEKLNSVE